MSNVRKTMVLIFGVSEDISEDLFGRAYLRIHTLCFHMHIYHLDRTMVSANTQLSTGSCTFRPRSVSYASWLCQLTVAHSQLLTWFTCFIVHVRLNGWIYDWKHFSKPCVAIVSYLHWLKLELLYLLDQTPLSISRRSRIVAARPDVRNKIVAALKY